MTKDVAIGYCNAGLSVIPVLVDGTKRPAVPWRPFQAQPADVAQIGKWFGSGRNGIGIIGGVVSGNLEILDFDDIDTAVKWWQVLSKTMPDLAANLVAIQTPSGGMHCYYRCDSPVTGNQKLAQRRDEDGKLAVLIETRGEGGYVIAPGSPVDCHPDGKEYVVQQGSLDALPVLTEAEREQLLEICRQFDEVVASKVDAPIRPQQSERPGERPGDAFNEAVEWNDLLAKHGWALAYRAGATEHWRRPGKTDEGTSATTNHNGSNLLYVFSSNADPFEPNTSYSKFAAFALLECGGDYKEATRRLGAQGYGEVQRRKPPKEPQPSGVVGAESELDDEPIWIEPTFFDVPSVPEIPCDTLPSPIADMALAIVNATQTPSGMAVMMALSVLATAAQKSFELKCNESYSEPLSLWTLTALPPASRKTAVIQALTEPLEQWERDRAESMREEIGAHETEQDVIQRRIEELKRKAGKTDDDGERLILIEQIAKLKAKIEPPKLAPRLWTTDVTPEKLQSLLMEHGEKMSLLSDESGIFEVMAGLYSDGKANIDVFLQAHAGKSCRVDRGSRTVHLTKPALSFGLMVQPKILSELGQGTKRRFRDIGALARFLYCLPVSNIGQRDVRQQIAIPDEIRLRYQCRIAELLNIEVSEPVRLTLATEAQEAYLAFAEMIEQEQGAGGEYEAISDWTGKLPGAVLRIAGLMHVAALGRDALAQAVIDGATMESAARLGALLIPHAQAALGSLGGDPEVADAKHILRWIQDNHLAEFKQNDLHRTGRFSNSKVDRVTKALDVLVARNIVSDQHRVPTRKPTIIYKVNPSVINLRS